MKHLGRNGFIYVCLFASGLIKVGRSHCPAQRVNAHERAAAIHDDPLVAVQIFGCEGDSRVAERKLIDRCAEFSGTRRSSAEWFRGIEFEIVVVWANELAADAGSPPPAVFARDFKKIGLFNWPLKAAEPEWLAAMRCSEALETVLIESGVWQPALATAESSAISNFQLAAALLINAGGVQRHAEVIADMYAALGRPDTDAAHRFVDGVVAEGFAMARAANERLVSEGVA